VSNTWQDHAKILEEAIDTFVSKVPQSFAATRDLDIVERAIKAARLAQEFKVKLDALTNPKPSEPDDLTG
jgi:hypothetical protein